MGNTKVNTRIRGVLAYGADMSLSSSLIPLTEGVDIPG
jgi:hypothetical protein